MHKIVHYLGIDDTAQRLAEAIWKITSPDMERVIDAFYANTRQRDTGVGIDDNTIARLRVRQKEHWRLLLQSRFDDAYFRHASMIGLTHQRIGLSASWYIAGYSIIKLELVRLLLKAPVSLSIKTQLIITLEKYVALDMACALSSYSAWLVD